MPSEPPKIYTKIYAKIQAILVDLLLKLGQNGGQNRPQYLLQKSSFSWCPDKSNPSIIGRGLFMLHHSPFSTSLGIVFSPPGNQWEYVSFGGFGPNHALRWPKCSKHPQNQRISLDCCSPPAPNSI